MTIPKPRQIQLDEDLLNATFANPSCHAKARAHMGAYLDSGGDANTKNERWTLLEVSACHEWTEEAERLLRLGADVHAGAGLALMWAADTNNTKIVSLLLAAGADVHARQEQALRWASERGHPAIVRLLLASGANVNVSKGVVLRRAALGQRRAVVEVLMTNGARIKEAVRHTSLSDQSAVLATIDACAAAIPPDQQTGLLDAFGKQMPALAALVQQEQRRTRRQAIP